MRIQIFLFSCCIGLFFDCNNGNESTNADALASYVDTSYGSIDVEETYAKLIPMDSIKSSVIIACGQSSHGSSENFRIQSGLFKYLVSQHITNTFLLEGNYSSVLTANEYISGAEISRDSVTRSLGFWIWDTEELWNLLNWMRERNGNHVDEQPLQFLGVDMQGVQNAAKKCLEVIKHYHLMDDEHARELLQPMLNDSSIVMKVYSLDEIRLFNSKWSYLVQSIDTSNLEFHSPNERQKYALEYRCFEILGQAIKYASTGFASSDNCRDSSMAVNTKWIVDHAVGTGCYFLWAHNYHVGVRNNAGGRSLGWHLRNLYGSKYYTIGVDYCNGDVNALTITRYDEKKSPDSVEYSTPKPCSSSIQKINSFGTLFVPDSGLVFVDLQSVRKDSLLINSGLPQSLANMHSIGAVFFGDDTTSTYKSFDVTEAFDGLILFAHSSPTTLLHSKAYTTHRVPAPK